MRWLIAATILLSRRCPSTRPTASSSPSPHLDGRILGQCHQPFLEVRVDPGAYDRLNQQLSAIQSTPVPPPAPRALFGHFGDMPSDRLRTPMAA